jgi:hypothetical protein
MKCNVIQSLNKRELQSFNGDEKFNEMLKRKAAIELAKFILEHMDYRIREVEVNELDEAEITEILFSVNVFSDSELWKYKEQITLDTLSVVNRLEHI